MAKKNFTDESKTNIESLIAPLTLDGWFEESFFQEKVEVPSAPFHPNMRELVKKADSPEGAQYAIEHKECLTDVSPYALNVFRDFVDSRFSQETLYSDALGLTHTARACVVASHVYETVLNAFKALPDVAPMKYKPKYDIKEIKAFIEENSEAETILKACGGYDDYEAMLTAFESGADISADEYAENVLDALYDHTFRDVDYILDKHENDISEWVTDNWDGSDLAEILFGCDEVDDKRIEAAEGWAEQWLYDNFAKGYFEADEEEDEEEEDEEEEDEEEESDEGSNNE